MQPRLTLRDNEQILLDGHVVAYLTNEVTDSPILRERLQGAFATLERPAMTQLTPVPD
jgi:hypothetical protein